MSAYNYSIRYKAGKSLGNADALSRLPQHIVAASDPTPGELVSLVNHLSETAINASNIKHWTDKDPTLSRVRQYLRQGKPTSGLDDEFKPYQARWKELSIMDGCVLRGSRVVVPPQGRQLVLDELHETHPGVNRMKALARSYIWWPNMDADIERVVKLCPDCQAVRPAPPSARLHPWEWPAQPWSRLHLDFAGPFQGHMFLVLVDAHSKWLDVHIMNSITSAKTIERLRMIFATHGLPQKIVTDNGPSFTSEEFRKFVQSNGIKHVTSAPYHPATNGLAERAVQTMKQGLRQMQGGSVQEKLSKFLFKYRITPHTTTGVAPSELLMGHHLRSRLDLLHPDLSDVVADKQAKQKKSHQNRPDRHFAVGDPVYVEDFTASSERWIPGVVKSVTGPLSYLIEIADGRTVRRHVDAVRAREVEVPQATSEERDWDDCPLRVPEPRVPEPVTETPPPPTMETTPTRGTAPTTEPPSTQSESNSDSNPVDVPVEPSAEAGSNSEAGSAAAPTPAPRRVRFRMSPTPPVPKPRSSTRVRTCPRRYDDEHRT